MEDFFVITLYMLLMVRLQVNFILMKVFRENLNEAISLVEIDIIFKVT